jgi:hypothetical protein
MDHCSKFLSDSELAQLLNDRMQGLSEPTLNEHLSAVAKRPCNGQNKRTHANITIKSDILHEGLGGTIAQKVTDSDQ